MFRDAKGGEMAKVIAITDLKGELLGVVRAQPWT